jgi:hypothetical protein
MKIACLALLALALAACADGLSPRQKYGGTYGVTGSNVPKKDQEAAWEDVTVYGPAAMSNLQNGGGPSNGDPMTPAR